jgi:hypothetical protein
MLGKLNRYLTEFGILLMMAALIAGMVGCVDITQNVEIRTWYELDAIRSNLDGSYILMNDLHSTTAGYQELAGPDGNEGMGWLPIGTEDDAFTGTFDGQGYEICDLFVIGSGLSHVGVFGFVGEGGQIEDIGVVDAEVVGDEVAGGLVGVCYGTVTDSYSIASVYGHDCAGGLVGLYYGTVTDSYSAGNVTSEATAGGLVGWNQGMVSNCYATATVMGGFVFVGGLVGLNDGTVTNSYSTASVTGSGPAIGGLVGGNGYSGPGTVSNSYSTGSVTGENGVGGLVGASWPEGIVSDCYATGNVDGEREVGGLVGGNAGTVSDSYSTGNATGVDNVGGLVGGNVDANVTNSYSTGNVTGESYVGGLVGLNEEGTVRNSYSTGSVAGNSSVGGLVGWNEEGTVNNSFWDTETSGQATSAGGTGKATAEMKNIATFSDAGWNISAVGLDETDPASIWNIVNGVTYPFLSWET